MGSVVISVSQCAVNTDFRDENQGLSAWVHFSDKKKNKSRSRSVVVFAVVSVVKQPEDMLFLKHNLLLSGLTIRHKPSVP